MPVKSRRGAPSLSGVAGKGTGARLLLRRGQHVALDARDEKSCFFIEQGCLTCELMLAGELRHIVLILYPGDVIDPGMIGPLPGARMVAAMPSTVARRPAADDNEAIAAGASRLLARACLHATAMGRLSAEERLATLLCDVALHLGRPAAGGYAFEVPLSRRDMADYLALNPDSLSRHMARLKARGLISMPTRSRAIAKDLDALVGNTPFGGALREMAVAELANAGR